MSSTIAEAEAGQRMPALEFLDTNVLVHAYEPDADERHHIARNLVADVGMTRRGAVSVQVLLEFHVTMSRKMRHGGYTPDVALARLKMLSRWPVHSPVAEDVVAATALSAAAQLSLWDATIIRSAERMGCSVLWTEDLTHGQLIAGVEIRNPFLG